MEIGPGQLLDNISVSADHGAEFAPFHLHAIPSIATLKGIDVILAGSYGDSVGRGEFSGRHLLRLNAIIPRPRRALGLLRSDMLRHAYSVSMEDVGEYHARFTRSLVHQQREIEQTAHYLRRKLQACMGVASIRVPLFQLFTAPSTVACTWRLRATVRTNDAYRVILRMLPGRIGNVPWARTGASPIDDRQEPDGASKLHHTYGVWLRRELRGDIQKLLGAPELRELNVLNLPALDRLQRTWLRTNTRSVSAIDEIVSWLACLSLFVQRFEVRGAESGTENWHDRIAAVVGHARGEIYTYVRNRRRL
jgi:asparagine synthase (glutamine-hydrolysing)